MSIVQNRNEGSYAAARPSHHHGHYAAAQGDHYGSEHGNSKPHHTEYDAQANTGPFQSTATGHPTTTSKPTTSLAATSPTTDHTAPTASSSKERFSNSDVGTHREGLMHKLRNRFFSEYFDPPV